MFSSTKIIELGSCAFRQPKADSHCKYLHGYRLTGKFWFEASELDHNNWVVDFGGLKELKKQLQDWYDHTTCISYSDPHVEKFKQLAAEGICDLRLMNGVGIEKFAEHCFNVANQHVQELTSGRCTCTKVEVFEHENNSAIFEMRSSSQLGAAYMEAKADEIAKCAEDCCNDEPELTSEQKSEPVKEVKAAKDVTRPPFKKKDEEPPLYQPKQTNTWIDKTGKSTWGL